MRKVSSVSRTEAPLNYFPVRMHSDTETFSYTVRFQVRGAGGKQFSSVHMLAVSLWGTDHFNSPLDPLPPPPIAEEIFFLSRKGEGRWGGPTPPKKRDRGGVLGTPTPQAIYITLHPPPSLMHPKRKRGRYT